MSLFKLAVYGGIGYLVYQMFFSDAAGGMRQQGRGEHSRRSGQGDQGDRGRQQQRFSGGGEGQSERTEEPSGMSSSHRVGRGVVT